VTHKRRRAAKARDSRDVFSWSDRYWPVSLGAINFAVPRAVWILGAIVVVGSIVLVAWLA